MQGFVLLGLRVRGWRNSCSFSWSSALSCAFDKGPEIENYLNPGFVEWVVRLASSGFGRFPGLGLVV